MSTETICPVTPEVPLSMYWREVVLLLFAWAIPVGAWLIWGDGMIMTRSGSLMVFFAAVAEFKTLNRMNTKHLLNACRVLDRQIPWDFSRIAKVVGIVSLISALAGTLLWSFGDLL